MTRYIRATEQAKMIRTALKIAFPGFKFDSVRQSSTGSMNVEWTNGPTKADVDAIVQKFAGGYFDGMTDYRGSYTKTFNGEEIGFLGDFVFTKRTVNEDFINEVKTVLKDFDGHQISKMLNMPGCRYMHEETDTDDQIAACVARITGQVHRTGNPELPVTIGTH